MQPRSLTAPVTRRPWLPASVFLRIVNRPPSFATYDSLCATHGAALTRSRHAAADRLRSHFLDFLKAQPPSPYAIDLQFSPGGSEDASVAESRLAANHGLDARRRQAAFGPHRDDVSVLFDGHPARGSASQGQHRLITLALKAAELALLTETRHLRPILLLDDISSELDAHRTSALLDHFTTAHSQVFLTTARPDLLQLPTLRSTHRRDIHLYRGDLAPAR